MRMELKNKRRTFLDSVKNCLEGIFYTFQHENNFKREIICGIFVIGAGFFFELSPIEWCIVLLLINFVLVCELINTALEKTVDLYTKEYNAIGKVIKDAAGGAVLTMCIFSSIIGIIIFLPKIINLINTII